MPAAALAKGATGKGFKAELEPVYGADMDRWREDPFLFFEEVLGLPKYAELDGSLTSDQIRLVEAILEHKHVACTSGNGTGKSYILAAIVLWFLATNEHSMVITTSASWEHVEDVLWPEIRKMYYAARDHGIPLGGKLLDTRLTFDEKWFGFGLSTDSATRFQGKHAGRVLIVIDEATGVKAEIFEAANTMANGEHDIVIATANPTDPSCDFKELVEPSDGRASLWHRVVISAEDHPNVIYGKTIIPGAVTRTSIQEVVTQFGEDSPQYDARVRGIWSKKAGRLFPDWNEVRHVYDPKEVAIQPWWTHWIAGDWGFAHNSAFFFFAWDGTTIYVYDEIVINNVTAGPLGDMVGRRANPAFGMGAGQEFMSVELAHDAFGHMGETGQTRAEMFSEASMAHGLPAATRASTDRIGGFNLITTLLRADGLKVSKTCEHLKNKMPQALRDPKKPEDALKMEGDDEIDALYKGVMARPTSVEMPKEMRMAQRVTAIDPHDRAMQARIAESDERRAGAGGSFASMRRGWRGGN